jgi:predicted transposase YbfD/YdcC
MKKRSIKKVPGTNEETLVTLIKNIPNKNIRSYAAFTYLFGNRVSEGIGIRKTVTTGYYEYERTTRKGTKTVYIKKIVNKENSEGIEYEIEPVQAWQIEYDEKKSLLWCRSLPTLKIPGRPVRDSWVLTNGPNEMELVEIVIEHTQKIIKEKGETAYLWELTRNNVYKAFRKHLGINNFPHKIRDHRATKDSTTYGLDAKDLKEKYHWQTSEMAMYYGAKNKTDIIEKMRRTNKEINDYNNSYPNIDSI